MKSGLRCISKNNFYFSGQAPLSKSLLNRALIVKSWFPEFFIHGTSRCEDIVIMEKAIESLKNKKNFHCGLSGTAFRFLSLRLSREKGEFLLTGEKELFQRPLDEVSSLLSQLSVQMQKTSQGFVMRSEGWKTQGDCVYVPTNTSSQYASALVLNSWDLKQELYFTLSGNFVSYPYFQMTLDFVKNLGLVVQQKGREFYIPKKQKLKKKEYSPEQDKGCLFALACFAVFGGKAVFLDWKEQSSQPDHIFLQILKEMGVSVELKDHKLRVLKTKNLKTLNVDLKGTPDLFPLLSVLCAKAEGLSQLKGLSHLAFKESHRLNKIQELLSACGIKMKIQKSAALIYGKNLWREVPPFVFDTAKDHRLLMAGELTASFGVPISLKGRESVNKSFPEFYSLIHRN